jgi:DNA-binding NarL/FixJ family response regulator
VKNVLIIQSENLLEAGLLTLLSSFEGIQVYGMRIEDLPTLPASLHNQQPDVLILDETVAQTHLESILPLLMSYPKVRTIVVSLSENSLSIYDKSQVSVKQISDFLTIL